MPLLVSADFSSESFVLLLSARLVSVLRRGLLPGWREPVTPD